MHMEKSLVCDVTKGILLLRKVHFNSDRLFLQEAVNGWLNTTIVGDIWTLIFLTIHQTRLLS